MAKSSKKRTERRRKRLAARSAPPAPPRPAPAALPMVAEPAPRATDSLGALGVLAAELERARADVRRLTRLRTKHARTLHDVHGRAWATIAADLGISTASLVRAVERTPTGVHAASTLRASSTALQTLTAPLTAARARVADLIDQRAMLVATCRAQGQSWGVLADAARVTPAALTQAW